MQNYFYTIGAISLSLIFFAWFLFPLKRLIGRLGLPPDQNLTKSIREGRFVSEAKALVSSCLSRRCERLVLLFVNFTLISYVCAFALSGLAYFLQFNGPNGSAEASIEHVMSAGFLFGLLVTSMARICAIRYSVGILRGLFVALSGTLCLVVYVIASDSSVMTEFTDYGLKASYGAFVFDSVPIVLGAILITEAVIDVTRGWFPVSRFAPIELFNSLSDLFQERVTYFGKSEIERAAIELIKKPNDHVGPVRSIDLVIANWENAFFDEVKRLSGLSQGELSVRVITTTSIASLINQRCGDVVNVAVIDDSAMLRCMRFMVVNHKQALVYQRVPSGEFDNANVAQLVTDFMQVRQFVVIFDEWFTSLTVN